MRPRKRKMTLNIKWRYKKTKERDVRRGAGDFQ